MKTKITDKDAQAPRGWSFYDAECVLCVRGVKRWNNLFARRGFCWIPLQTPGTAERLRVDESSLREEMKLLLASGQVLGGIDAWAVLFRSIWWLWPLGALLRIPGVRWLGAIGYRWIARNRYCIARRCELHDRKIHSHRHNAFFEMP